MPKLPDKTALGQPPSFDPGRPLVQVSLGGQDPGAAALDMLGEASRKLGGVFAKIGAKVKEADDYEVQKALIDFDLEQEKKLDDAKRNAAPEAKGFTDGYRSSYDADAQSFMQRVPARLKPKLDEILVKRGAGFEKRAYDFELAERDRFNVDDVNKKLTELYNETMATGDHVSNAERGTALIKGSRLTERAKMKALPEFLDRNEEYAVRALADKYAAEGKDVSEIIENLRKVPRGSWVKSPAPAGGESTIDLIKKFEGERDVGWDVSQYSGPYGVKRGKDEKLTLEQADQRLRQEVAEVEKEIDAKIKTPLTDNQRAALTSLFYNIGTGKGRLDQVAKMIEAGDIDKVPAWIRQYNKADGRTLRGLTTRRGEEAALFQRAGSPSGAGAVTLNQGADSEVIRTDLPPPGDGPVLPEKRAPKINPETGEVVKDIGTDQSDMPKAGASGSVVANDQMDEPFESDVVPYRHLSPANRRKLINVLRGHARAQVTTEITDEVERIRLGREPRLDDKGRTALDRARAMLPPVQFRKIQDAWTEAKLERDAIAPLSGMTREQMQDHAVGVFRKAEENEDSLRIARKVRDKAERATERLLKLRDSDPVRAIEGYVGEESDERRQALPNTRAAMRAIQEAEAASTVVMPDGTRAKAGSAKPRLSPHQQWEMIFDARLKDQEAIMPDEPDKHRIISRRQAEKLIGLPKDGKNVDDRTFRQKLTEAADRAEQWYGPKYAKRVMQEAIGFHLSGGSQEHKDAQANVLRKMVSGEPILFDDVRKVRDLENLKRSGLNFGGDALSNLDRVGRGVQMPIAPMGDPGRPAIAQTFQPSERHVDWLRQNPDGWQTFDEKFGPGASALVLGPGSNPWGEKRQAVPKAKAGSPEDRAATAAKPKDKSWWQR